MVNSTQASSGTRSSQSPRVSSPASQYFSIAADAAVIALIEPAAVRRGRHVEVQA